MNVLFVCSKNKWRSPTAEIIYENHAGITVRSAGTEPTARIKLNLKTILWADIIFVMEKKHKERIMEKFGSEIEHQTILILDIPDDYKFMDPELIEDLKTKVNTYLGLE